MDVIRARAFVAVLALGIAACDHGSSPPKGDPIPREVYVDTSVREICAALEKCCSSRGFRFNAEACAANVRESDFGLDGPTTFCPAPALYDAQAAGNCLAEQKAALSSCALDPRPASAACRRICTGTVAAGQPCTSGTDCATDETGWSMCSPPRANPGKCVQEARGKVGDLCKAGFTRSPYGYWGVMSPALQTEEADWAICDSADGLYCASDALTEQSTCEPFLGVGQQCSNSLHTLRNHQTVEGVVGDTDSVCAPELYCNEAGSCVARRGVGEACTDDDQCVEFVCGSTTGRCLPAGVQDITAEFCADPT